jgi:hypothetical protein
MFYLFSISSFNLNLLYIMFYNLILIILILNFFIGHFIKVLFVFSFIFLFKLMVYYFYQFYPYSFDFLGPFAKFIFLINFTLQSLYKIYFVF